MRYATSTACLPGLLLLTQGQGHAEETSFQLRYQNYREEDHRIAVDATYLDFHHLTDSGFSLGVQYAHDSLSGATPIGTYDAANPNLWEYQHIEDVRQAVVIDVEQEFGDFSLALEYSRSTESDYLSEGAAIRGTGEFCNKNTVVTAGLSVTNDKILSSLATTILQDENKDSFDLSLGLTQILDRNTFVDFNLSYGESSGYLSDPYRRISETDTFTVGGFSFVDTISHPENRPSWQRRMIGRAAVTHYFEPLHAALEASYRYYGTSDSLDSHTFELRWRHQVTEKFSVSPFFRYYIQSAADFYYPSLTGTPIDGTGRTDGVGPNYSSDYRLAALETLSYGIGFRYEPLEGLALDLQLERYEMSGRNASTPSEFFPSANVVSAGVSYHF